LSRRIRDQTPEERRLEGELLREQRDEADRLDLPALVRMMKKIAEEDAAAPQISLLPPFPAASYRSPDTADEQLAAAGGYSTSFTLEFEDEGFLEVDASWTSARIDLTWDYRELEPTSFLIIAFRDGATSVFLAPPVVAGRVDQQSWSATADELGLELDRAWELVVLVMR